VLKESELRAMNKKARIEIEYCTQCGFLLRAAWLAQELLQAFGSDLGEVALVPGRGGVFVVRVDREEVFSRRRDGCFPDALSAKRRIAAGIGSSRRFGHEPDTAAHFGTFDNEDEN